jgi:hypothetical protein
MERLILTDGDPRRYTALPSAPSFSAIVVVVIEVGH